MLKEKPTPDLPGSYRYWTAWYVSQDVFKPLEAARSRLARVLREKGDAREALVYLYHRYCVLRHWIARVVVLENTNTISLGAYHRWRRADETFYAAIENEIGKFDAPESDDVILVDGLKPVLRSMRTLNEHAACRRPLPDLPRP